MKLAYRGVNYEVKLLTIAAKEGKVIGKYRGANLHERIVAKQ